MAKGLYVHIPFCTAICTYCDFPKTVAQAGQKQEYVAALKTELATVADTLGDVETIYLGGGTPSALGPALLAELLDAIAAKVDLSRVLEYTIETNPNDVDAAFVRLLKAKGVDRVSLGAQSSHPRLLKLLGRTHAKEDVERAVAALHDLRFYNVNLDFMYALPTETAEELAADLEFACGLQPTHLSFYALIIEPRTILFHAEKQGRLVRLDEEAEAAMFETVNRILPARGYPRYEVSNFAIPGFESKHNLRYWNVQEYLGVGMAAHSQLGETRFHNQPTLSRYLSAVKKTGLGDRIEDPCDLLREACLMGLRKVAGIDRADVWRRYQTDVVRRFPRLLKNLDEGLVVIDDQSVRLTAKGLLLMNYVEKSFM